MYVGECWSGTKAASRYNRYGTSQQCIDLRQQPCDEGSVGECAGEQHSNYVYRIVVSQGEPVNGDLTQRRLLQQIKRNDDIFPPPLPPPYGERILSYVSYVSRCQPTIFEKNKRLGVVTKSP